MFHSSAETMLEFQGELPFAVIADPDKKLYAEFGVESSLKAVLNPRAPLAGFRARSVVHSVRGAMGIGEKHLGLPAEFLIAPDGVVLAASTARRKRPVVGRRTARPREARQPTAPASRHANPRERQEPQRQRRATRLVPEHRRSTARFRPNDARQRRAGRHAGRPRESCPRIPRGQPPQQRCPPIRHGLIQHR